MNKILMLVSCIVFVSFTGCSNTTVDSHQHKPMTISLETLISEGSISHQSFHRETTDLLEKTMDSIIATKQITGISAAVAIPNQGTWSAVRGLTACASS